MTDGIYHLQRHEVDTEKWNACIESAANGLIYGYAFYLDAMCTDWDALVLNNYAAVMPLPWRKKFGICYLYQPFAVAQLGLFGNGLSAELLHGFLKKIPPKFQYWDVPLNFGNRFLVPHFTVYERKNYVLHLSKPYETLNANYRQQTKRNLKKAATQKLYVQKSGAVDVVIDLAKKHYANSGATDDYNRFRNLYHLLFQNKQASMYSVQSATGEVLATAIFFYANSRVYYILPGNAADARTSGASPFLIDRFINDHAEQKLILDFEGSDVPGLQFFYSSFGAVEEPYAAIRLNRLPLLLRWLKK